MLGIFVGQIPLRTSGQQTLPWDYFLLARHPGIIAQSVSSTSGGMNVQYDHTPPNARQVLA
jgi:hypothetical protein